MRSMMTEVPEVRDKTMLSVQTLQGALQERWGRLEQEARLRADMVSIFSSSDLRYWIQEVLRDDSYWR